MYNIDVIMIMLLLIQVVKAVYPYLKVTDRHPSIGQELSAILTPMVS